MASDGLGKVLNKKGKLAGKPCCRQKSLFVGFGSTLKGFLTTSFLRESSQQSTSVCQCDHKEAAKTQVTKTIVEVNQTDNARAGDSPPIQGPSSDLAEIRESIKVETLLGGFGSTLKDFLTTSFLREPSQQSTNTGQNDYKEEEKTPKTKTGVEARHRDEARTGNGPQIQGPSLSVVETNLKATREGIKVEVDFLDLSLLARVGSTLREYLTPPFPSFLREPSCQSTNKVADDSEEEETQQAMTGVEVGQTNVEDTGEPPIQGPSSDVQIQRPSSDVGEGSVKTTKDGICVEYDGYQATFSHATVPEDQNLASNPGSLSSISRPPLSSVVGRTSAVAFSEMQPLASRVSSGPPSASCSSSTKRSTPMPSGDDSTSDASKAFSLGEVVDQPVGAPSKKRCVERNNVRTAVVDQPGEPGEEPNTGTSSGKPSGGEKSFMWQTQSNPSSASGSRSWTQQTPAASAKPRFDMPTFCSTIYHSEQGQRDSSLLNRSQRQSPFYTGKTTYGGASARSKTVNFDPEYQVVRHQVTKIRPVASRTGELSLSSTAKLILQGLDKTEQLNDTLASSFNSSHLDSPLSFTPRTYKRNSLQASSSKTQLASKAGPPVREQVTPTYAIIQRNIETYQHPDSRTVSRTANVDQDAVKSLTYAPMTYGLPSAGPSTQAPGKMRREQTRKHYSSKATEKEDETPMIVDLSSIALPVTNLQPLTSNILSAPSAGFLAGSRDKPESMDTTTFTFSKPIMMDTESKPTEDVDQKSFHFRSPIAVDDHRSNGITTSSQQPPAPSSVVGTSEPASKGSLAYSFNLNAAVKKPQLSSESPSGGFAPATELKRGSVMDLLGRPSNSPASTSPPATMPATKPVASSAGVVDDNRPLSELFKATTNKWSCPGCLVQNDNKLTECPCCFERQPGTRPAPGPAPAVSAVPSRASFPVSSTPKPLTELFKPSSDMWKCPTCDVKNANSMSDCPCCSTKRPGGSRVDSQPSAYSVFPTTGAGARSAEEPTANNEASKSSNLPSLSSLFQKPPGDWVCPTCSVPNKEHQLTCCACEEPKPGAKPAASNGALSPAPTTGPNGGQVEAQGFKYSPAAFGSTATGQSVFKAPSSTDGTGIAPGGGFKVTLPPGGFSGFGTGFSAPQPSSDKQDSVPVSGGFQLPGFVSFGQAPKNDTNGPSTKPKILSFLPSASNAAAKSEANTVTPGFAITQFVSTEFKPSGFSFKPNNGSESNLKAAPGGFAFGSSSVEPFSSGQAVTSGFQFGEKVSSEKKVDNTSTLMQRPPLRPDDDKSNENFKVDNVGSSAQNNRMAPMNSFQSNVTVFGSNSSAFDSAKSVLPTSSTPFSFGAPMSTSVATSSALLFGPTKPSTDVSAPKFNFSTTPSSTAVPLTTFGAPPTSFAIGATQPVFTAPSSITSAAVAPPASTAGGFFAPPTMPVDKPAGQEAAKSNLFNFGQNPSEAGPAFVKFGETQPVKEEAKPAATNIFQFGQQPQQPQNTASGGLFQFGASKNNNAASGAGMFNSTGTSQPGPVFGQAAAVTAPGLFNFGAGSNAQSNPAGIFTFGAKPSDAAPKPDVMSFSQLGSKRSMDDDGVGSKRGRSGSEDMPMQDVDPMQSPKQLSVGVGFNPPPTGFGFNAIQASAPVSNPGFFGAKPGAPMSGFGNPSNAAAPAVASPFSFTGQQPAAPAPAFGTQNVSNLANGSAGTGGFTFGTGAVASSGFNFGGSAPSFNFPAAPSNANSNNPFNAQPSGPAPPAGRTIKRAVRRSNIRK